MVTPVTLLSPLVLLEAELSHCLAVSQSVRQILIAHYAGAVLAEK